MLELLMGEARCIELFLLGLCMKFTTANNLSLKLRLIRARRFTGISDAALRNTELSQAEADKAFAAGEKLQLPLLVTDQLIDASGNLADASLVIADFDRKDMPEGMSEAELRASLAGLKDVVLLESVSGMPKAAWLTDRAVSREQGIEVLKEQLPEKLHWFDKAGLFKCFIPSYASAQSLQNQLVSNRAVQVSVVATASTIERSEMLRHAAPQELTLASSNICNIQFIPSTYLLCTAFAEDIPAKLQHLAKNEAQRSMLRLLLSCWNLLNPLGYGLSQHRIAKQLNIDVMQVNRFLKQLQRLNLLFKTSKDYCQGRKAQCYRAQGILAKVIRKLKAKPRKKLILPKRWEKGNTYQPMLNLLWVNQSLDLPSWLHLVQSIPGATPARLNDETRYWQCQFKKLAGKAKAQKQA